MGLVRGQQHELAGRHLERRAGDAIDAVPSSTWATASNGDVCSLKPLTFIEREHRERAPVLFQENAAHDGSRLIGDELRRRGRQRRAEFIRRAERFVIAQSILRTFRRCRGRA